MPIGRGDQETLQSISGYIYLLSSGAISWQNKKQKQEGVTLSSTEEEYVAISTLALKEYGLWLKHFLKERTLFPDQPTTMLAKKFKHSELTKHIAMKL
jgi:hypothetical protein